MAKDDSTSTRVCCVHACAMCMHVCCALCPQPPPRVVVVMEREEGGKRREEGGGGGVTAGGHTQMPEIGVRYTLFLFLRNDITS